MAQTPDERRYRDLPSSYPQYRDLMLLAESDRQTVGTVIGIGSAMATGGESSVLVKGLGVSENHRGTGLGRQLLERLDMNAAQMLRARRMDRLVGAQNLATTWIQPK